MRKALRGYAKDKNDNLILIGTMPVPFSKDKCATAVRQQKRHLVRQGATIFRKETIRSCEISPALVCDNSSNAREPLVVDWSRAAMPMGRKTRLHPAAPSPPVRS